MVLGIPGTLLTPIFYNSRLQTLRWRKSSIFEKALYTLQGIQQLAAKGSFASASES